MEVEVVFSKEEVRKLVESEYVRLFGPIPDGYELNVWDHYGDIKAQVRKMEVPEPVAQAPEPVPAVNEF